MQLHITPRVPAKFFPRHFHKIDMKKDRLLGANDSRVHKSGLTHQILPPIVVTRVEKQ